jgi:nucleoside-diphosphate-sugar epimerase
MKCLVTGAAGFIGSHLSEALIKRGNEVRGVDCFTDYYAKNLKLANLTELKNRREFEFVEADITSDTVSKYVKDVDIVFHLAAQPGVRASWGASFSHYIKDNIAATQRLLEAAKEVHLKRFIYASSSSIYGDAERFPTPEDTTPSPNSPYGATKFEAELLCNVYRKNFGVPTVVLRYFTVYGPRQRPDMAFNRFISAIQRGEEVVVFGDGSQGRDFTFVLDTVAATCLSAEAEPGSTYNVGTGSTITVNEVLSILERIIGKQAKIRREPAAPGDVRMTCAETSKIERELGFHPKIKIEEGLRKQVEASLKT